MKQNLFLGISIFFLVLLVNFEHVNAEPLPEITDGEIWGTNNAYGNLTISPPSDNYNKDLDDYSDHVRTWLGSGNYGSAMCVKSDGTRLWSVNSSDDDIDQWDFGTAFDTRTLTLDHSLDTPETTLYQVMTCSDDGTKIIVEEFNGSKREWTLLEGTAWELDTFVETDSWDGIDDNGTSTKAIEVWNNEQTILAFVVIGGDVVDEYSWDSFGDFNSLSYVGRFDLDNGNTNGNRDSFISEDGLDVYFTASNTSPNKAYHTSLVTPYDLSVEDTNQEVSVESSISYSVYDMELINDRIIGFSSFAGAGYVFEKSIPYTMYRQCEDEGDFTSHDTMKRPTSYTDYLAFQTLGGNGGGDTPPLDQDFDFSSSDGWTSSDETPEGFFTITGGEIDFNISPDSSEDYMYYDLGAGLSTPFSLRFKLNLDAYEVTGTNNHFFIGLDSTTSGDIPTSSSDGIGFRISENSGSLSQHLYEIDGGSKVYTTLDTWSPSLSTDYFLEIVVFNSTTAQVNVYSDSSYGSDYLIDSATDDTITALVSSMDLIKMSNWQTGGVSTQPFDGIIDDMTLLQGYESQTFTLTDSANRSYCDYKLEYLGTNSTTFRLSVDSGGSIPTAPVLHTVQGLSSNKMNVDWDAPTNDGGSAITGYQIERKQVSSWETIVSDTGSTTTQYTDGQLAKGTGYTYRISAINTIGVGNPSNELSGTTKGGGGSGGGNPDPTCNDDPTLPGCETECDDTDSDGICDTVDGCPNDPNNMCLPDDEDNDGIPNDHDWCPFTPETFNGFEDLDGCPDELPANDQDWDGIVDTDDSDPSDPCLPNPENTACLTNGDNDRDGFSNDEDPEPLDPCEPDKNHEFCPTKGNDRDSDGINNGKDEDPDDACIPDPLHPACVSGGDIDGDDTPDFQDTKPFDPCVPNGFSFACLASGGYDDDSDEILNGVDHDPDDPCIPNPSSPACSEECVLDSDLDGTPNCEDNNPTDPCLPDPGAWVCDEDFEDPFDNLEIIEMELFNELSLIGNTHNTKPGAVINDEMIITWNSNEDLRISKIVFGSSQADFKAVPIPPYILKGGLTFEVSTGLLPYEIIIPPQFCSVNIRTDCIDKAVHTVPVIVESVQDGVVVKQETEIILNLTSSFPFDPIWFILLTFPFLFFLFLYRKKKKKKRKKKSRKGKSKQGDFLKSIQQD